MKLLLPGFPESGGKSYTNLHLNYYTPFLFCVFNFPLQRFPRNSTAHG